MILFSNTFWTECQTEKKKVKQTNYNFLEWQHCNKSRAYGKAGFRNLEAEQDTEPEPEPEPKK